MVFQLSVEKKLVLHCYVTRLVLIEKLAPLFIQSEPRNQQPLARGRFPALCVSYTYLLSFDWFTVLSVSFAIG